MARRSSPTEAALYVRLPVKAVGKLDRAAQALGVHKKELVARLVASHVDPDSRDGLSALGALSRPRAVAAGGDRGPTFGSYSFQPHDAPDPPAVMNPAQTAQLLQLDEQLVLELAEAGELPGKKLGTVWRFSRAAVIAWLSAAEPG